MTRRRISDMKSRMRKFAWLFLLAAAALFSAPENAFAHAGHHHVQPAQTKQASSSHAQPAAVETEQSVRSTIAVMPVQCPHGGSQPDCGFCCANTGNASAALADSEIFGQSLQTRSERFDPEQQYEIRQTVLDLTRPPKSFA
jgi:hypothetical protein